MPPSAAAASRSASSTCEPSQAGSACPRGGRRTSPARARRARRSGPGRVWTAGSFETWKAAQPPGRRTRPISRTYASVTRGSGMCWKTTCETHAEALASSIPASDDPAPRSHSTLARPGLSSRARSSMAGETSSARTRATRAASGRVSRPSPQPISTTSSSAWSSMPTAASSRSRSASPPAQNRFWSG